MRKYADIPLVEYDRDEEILNTLTHAAGLVLCGFIAVNYHI